MAENIMEEGISPLQGVRGEDLYNTQQDSLAGYNAKDYNLNVDNEELWKRQLHAGFDPARNSALYEDLNEAQETNLHIGKSKYDAMSVGGDTTQEDINDNRAEEQSFLTKIACGSGKFVGAAVTSFLSHEIGNIYGAYKAIDERDVSAWWNNPFEEGMQQLNEQLEEWMPNYMTTEEAARYQNDEWYKNMFSHPGNFIGDNLLKNFGYAVGSMGAMAVDMALLGGTGTALRAGKMSLQAVKAAKSISEISSTLKNAAPGVSGLVRQLVSSSLGGIAEARTEALTNSNDWKKLPTQQENDRYNEEIRSIIKNYGKTPEGYAAMAEAREKHLAALDEIDALATKMGNQDMALNGPICTAGNFFIFGKSLLGFADTKLIRKSIGDGLYNYAARETKTNVAKVGAQKMIEEGGQEMLQKWASNTTGNFATEDWQGFYKAGKDYNAERTVLDTIKQSAKHLYDTFTDPGDWEEGFIGGLTGLLGVPGFTRKADGKYGFMMMGNAWSEANEQNKRAAEDNLLAESLNKRINDPKFKAYYQGMVRHEKFNQDMQRAIDNDDPFEYKNAEASQLVSDIIMFDKAGKLGDMMSMIKDSQGYADNDLNTIISSACTVDENGKIVGPYAQYAKVDKNNNLTASFPSDKEKNDFIDKVKKRDENLIRTIAEYRAVKDRFTSEFGDKISDESIGELTWMQMQIANWHERNESMAEDLINSLSETKNGLSVIKSDLESKLNNTESPLNELAAKSVASTLNKIDVLLNSINELDKIKSQKGSLLVLTSNPEFISTLRDTIVNADEFIMPKADKDKSLKLLKDMSKVSDAIVAFNKKLSEFSENPSKIEEENKKEDEDLLKEAERNQLKEKAKNNLEMFNGSSMSALMDAVENAGNLNMSWVKNLDHLTPNERNELMSRAEDAKEMLSIINEAKKKMQELGVSDEEKKLILKGLDYLRKNAPEYIEDLNNEDFTKSIASFIQIDRDNLINEVKSIFNANNMPIDNNAIEALVEEKKSKIGESLSKIFSELAEAKKDIEDLVLSDEEAAAKAGITVEEYRKRKNEETSNVNVRTTKRRTPATSIPSAEKERQQQKRFWKEKLSKDGADAMPKLENGQHGYWKLNTTEEVTASVFNRENLVVGSHVRFHTIEEKWQKKAKDSDKKKYHPEEHKIIWEFLNNSGAFNRVNLGQVKKGTRLRVATFKSLNDATGHIIPVLVMPDPENKGKWVVVGDMISAMDNYEQFPNYKDFLKNIRETYFKWLNDNNLSVNKEASKENVSTSTDSSNFVLTDISIGVSNVLHGKPNFTPNIQKSRHTLNEIAEGDSLNKEFKLAVTTKGGVIVDSGSINAERTDLENSVNAPANKDIVNGQPFVLVGDENNGYMTVPIRMPAFNHEDAKTHHLGMEALRWIDKIDSLSGDSNIPEEKLEELAKSIQSVFNFGSFSIKKNEDRGAYYLSGTVGNLKTGKKIGFFINSNAISNQFSQVEAIYKAFENAGVGYQVDITKINRDVEIGSETDKVPYNTAIGEVATANLSTENGLHLVNNLVMLNYIDEEGKEVIPQPLNRKRRRSYQSTMQEYTSSQLAQLAPLDVIKYLEDRYNDIVLPDPDADRNYYTIMGVRKERVHTIMGDAWNYDSKVEKKEGNNRSTRAGTEVDRVCRQVFGIIRKLRGTGKANLIPNPNTSNIKVFKDSAIFKDIEYDHKALAGSCIPYIIRNIVSLEAKTHENHEIPFAENIVVDYDFDGVKVAGELDLITVDDKGEFRIYDFKTASITPDGKYNRSFAEKISSTPPYLIRSDKFSYTVQLNMYASALEKKFPSFRLAKKNGLNLIPLPIVKWDDITHSKATDVRMEELISLNRDESLVDNAIEAYKNNQPIIEPEGGYYKETTSKTPVDAKKKSSKSTKTSSTSTQTKGKKTVNINGKKVAVADETTEELSDEEMDALGLTEYTGGSNQQSSTSTSKQTSTSTTKKTPNIDSGNKTKSEKKEKPKKEVKPSANSKKIEIKKTDSNFDDRKRKEAINSISGKLGYEKEDLDGLSNDALSTILHNMKSKLKTINEILENHEPREWNEAILDNNNDNPNDFIPFSKSDSVFASMPRWNEVSRQKEIDKLQSILPQMFKDNAVRIVDSIARVADKGPEIFGYYIKGVTVLAKNAVEGTGYHESFHFVVDSLLSEKEKQELFGAAADVYGRKSEYDLEELLAEGFKSFMLTEGRNSLDEDPNESIVMKFFKTIANAVKGMFSSKKHIYSVYRSIAKGKYANRVANSKAKARASKTLNDILKNAPRDGEGRLLAPNGKPSNLTELQYAQVRTKEFKDWFGDWEKAAERQNATKVRTPIKDKYKGKLIFAAPGTGKTSIADNETVFDSDFLLGQTLGVSSAQAGEAFSLLSNKEKQAASKKYEQAIKGKLKEGKTVITARLASLKDADTIVYNSSAEMANQRTSDNLRENPFENQEYANKILQEIENNKKTSKAEFISLREDEYLGSKILDNPNFNIRVEKVKSFSKVEDAMKSFFNDFGVTFWDLNEAGYSIDYVNKIIKSFDKESMLNGGGEMIAFMMQYNGTEKRIITDLAIADGTLNADEVYDRNGNIKTYVYKNLDKSKYFKIIGQSIAKELESQFDNVKNKGEFTKKPSSGFINSIKKLISDFLNLVLKNKDTIQTLADYSVYVSSNILYGNTSLVKKSLRKPGDEEKGRVYKVDLKKAFDENPYELDIVKKLSSENILLAGSAAIAAVGSVFRPKENPLHDLDFNAGAINKAQLEEKINPLFGNLEFVREIQNEDSTTETYLTMSEPFEIKKPLNGFAVYEVVSKETGETIASFTNSNLTILKEGVQGKFLDFFIGEKVDSVDYEYSGYTLKMADWQKAIEAKIGYGRLKDIFDYNRFTRDSFIPNVVNTEQKANMNGVSKEKEEDINNTVDYLYDVNSELKNLAPKYIYAEYLASKLKSNSSQIYWHGTDSDFSDGLNSAKRTKGSGALETGSEMYFNKQPWASLQYISGVNRTKPDSEGFNNWAKLWWSMKEILGNGRMNTDDWKHEIIGKNVRQEIPNKKGIFNRNNGGENGSFLSERKAKYGYKDKTDKEFFEEVFDIRYSVDTFQDWVDRKSDEFKKIWSDKSVKKGIYPVILNLSKPIIEEGQDTYYEEHRGLFFKAKKEGFNSIISNKAKNEFGSDVAIVFNPRNDVDFLGSKSDIENFKKWLSKNDSSKVIDENGEPLVVYHGSIYNERFTVFNDTARYDYKDFVEINSPARSGYIKERNGKYYAVVERRDFKYPSFMYNRKVEGSNFQDAIAKALNRESFINNLSFEDFKLFYNLWKYPSSREKYFSNPKQYCKEHDLEWKGFKFPRSLFNRMDEISSDLEMEIDKDDVDLEFMSIKEGVDKYNYKYMGPNPQPEKIHIFATPDIEVANAYEGYYEWDDYSGNNIYFPNENPRPKALFLNIRNPKEVDAMFNFYDQVKIENRKMNDYLRVAANSDKGIDGAIIKNIGDAYDLSALVTTDYVFFDKSQAKLAIGNNGNFDKNDADIRFSTYDGVFSKEEALLLTESQKQEIKECMGL